MSTFLRKVRSTIRPDRTSKQSKSTSIVDISTAVESPLSVNTRHSVLTYKSPNTPSPADGFRTRLARKASTISLRNKSRKGEQRSTLGKRKSLFLGHKKYRSSLEEDERQVHGERDSSTSIRQSPDIHELPAGERTPTQEDFPFLPHGQHFERGKEVGVASWVKMSSEASTPPIPLTRLKEIAVNACSTTLADQSSYVHSKTESWNTSIINSILGTLVKETTPPSASQPQWKYVVNSTIIQHAAATSLATDGEGGESSQTRGGRRGMHSASGAYWNNEKDGMWSFKYEGAEGKGLDVVVGVTWIWVG